MKCQILFSGKNKKNILKCRLLQILPRVLSVKAPVITAANNIHFFMPPPAEGRSGAYSISPPCYVHMWACHVHITRV